MAPSTTLKSQRAAARNNQNGNEKASRGAGTSGAVNQASNQSSAQVRSSTAQGPITSSRNNHQLPIQGPAPIGNAQGDRTVPHNMPERASDIGMSGPPSSSIGSGHTSGHVGGTLLGVGHEQADFPANKTRPSTSRPRTQDGIYIGRENQIPDPNDTITEVEDNHVKADLVTKRPSSEFCIRPGYGSEGARTILWTNYLELKMQAESLILNYYTISIDPDTMTKKVPKGDRKKRLIRLLFEHGPFQEILRGLFVSDFNTTIITKEPLGPGPRDFTIDFKAEGAVHPSAFPVAYTIRIGQPVSLDMVDGLNLSTLASDQNKLQILRAYNVILGHHSKESHQLAWIGSKKVYPLNSTGRDLGRGLIAMRGFYSNVIRATSRTLVNVNISHGAFYKASYNGARPNSLHHLMWACCSQDPNNFEPLHRFLRGLRVSTTHLKEEHQAFGKIRKISGLAVHGDGKGSDYPSLISPGKEVGGNPWEVQFFETGFAQSSSNSDSSNARDAKALGKGQIAPPSESTKGSWTTVKKFFERTYPDEKNIEERIAFRNPVVNVGTRAKPIYLPAEVCKVLPGQVSRTRLDAQQTRNMIGFAKCDPDQCAMSIVEQGREALNYASGSKPMTEFGVAVGDELITVPGRVLDTPTIEYQKIAPRDPNTRPRVPTTLRPGQGSWNFAEVGLYKPAELGYCFDAHLHKFGVMLKDCGIQRLKPLTKEQVVPNLAALTAGLESCLKGVEKHKAKLDTKEKRERSPPLLLIVLPGKVVEPYRALKTYADTELGIHTVCVIGNGITDQKNSRKFYNKDPEQYFANVILKMNLKLGGINHKLATKSQPLEFIERGTTMVVGIDVTHPFPGSSQYAPSVFAVVASMDECLAQWPVRFGVQKKPGPETMTAKGQKSSQEETTARAKKSGQEVITDTRRLSEMFRELVELWRERHKGVPPENIIVYRDGVSEGQYSDVLDLELAALRTGCSKSYANARGPPRFSFIVAVKRHHTRFYPTHRKDADKLKNARCGTVVDRGIMQARTWDFFLQSHSVISGGKEYGPNGRPIGDKPAGTARPAHYIVLHDEVFAREKKENRANLLQKITHNMCYLYGPATKAISVCPPVYLADKACTRARLYLHSEFDPPTQAELDARKDPEDETAEETEEREQKEAQKLADQMGKIRVHDNLKNTMFYI